MTGRILYFLENFPDLNAYTRLQHPILTPRLHNFPSPHTEKMATKTAKTGEKRKATDSVDHKKAKPTVKKEAKKEGPDSTRKLFRNEDASDDSSDDDLDNEEDGGAAVAPAPKKVKQAKESNNAEDESKTETKAERSKFWVSMPIVLQYADTS